ncbi:hypothetical protein [Fodinibius sp. Rm-B-1B1-1]|uniref:hypothetical protein n=1 Tax=Fodinibius alkaliphilus TaxID=3140241 RepID=UPI00315AB84B
MRDSLFNNDTKPFFSKAYNPNRKAPLFLVKILQVTSSFNNKTLQLWKDYNKLDLNNLDKRLCQLARELTLHLNSIDEDKYITPLKNTGLSDRAILDAVLVVSYFNFVNHMVLGVGGPIQGYKY